jgi:serine/threonine protein phosphatase PrpC
VSPQTRWLEVATLTRLGARLEQHHLQQRGVVDADRGLVAVIRGYGGQSSGDVAENVAAEELARTDDVPAALAAASQRLARWPKEEARTAVVTALVLRPPRMTVVHIGACRAYRVRSGALQRLTEDHVMAIPAEFGGFVPTRQLGREPDAPDVTEYILDAGDRYLVVDGVTARAVSDAEILVAMCGNDAYTAAETIVDLAHARVHDRSASAAVGFVRRTRERL